MRLLLTSFRSGRRTAVALALMLATAAACADPTGSTPRALPDAAVASSTPSALSSEPVPTPLTGRVALAGPNGTRNIVVHAVTGESATVQANGRFTLAVPSDRASLVVALRDGAPVAMAVVGRDALSRGRIELDAASTADALVLTAPMVWRTAPALVDPMSAAIRSAPEGVRLAKAVADVRGRPLLDPAASVFAPGIDEVLPTALLPLMIRADSAARVQAPIAAARSAVRIGPSGHTSAAMGWSSAVAACASDMALPWITLERSACSGVSVSFNPDRRAVGLELTNPWVHHGRGAILPISGAPVGSTPATFPIEPAEAPLTQFLSCVATAGCATPAIVKPSVPLELQQEREYQVLVIRRPMGSQSPQWMRDAGRAARNETIRDFVVTPLIALVSKIAPMAATAKCTAPLYDLVGQVVETTLAGEEEATTRAKVIGAIAEALPPMLDVVLDCQFVQLTSAQRAHLEVAQTTAKQLSAIGLTITGLESLEEVGIILNAVDALLLTPAVETMTVRGEWVDRVTFHGSSGPVTSLHLDLGVPTPLSVTTYFRGQQVPTPGDLHFGAAPASIVRFDASGITGMAVGETSVTARVATTANLIDLLLDDPLPVTVGPGLRGLVITTTPAGSLFTIGADTVQLGATVYDDNGQPVPDLVYRWAVFSDVGGGGVILDGARLTGYGFVDVRVGAYREVAGQEPELVTWNSTILRFGDGSVQAPTSVTLARGQCTTLSATYYDVHGRVRPMTFTMGWYWGVVGGTINGMTVCAPDVGSEGPNYDRLVIQSAAGSKALVDVLIQ